MNTGAAPRETGITNALTMRINNREQGKRIFVCGTSPNLPNLNPVLLQGGVVIGLNRYYRYGHCDYWICADTAPAAWEAFGKDIFDIKAIRFLHGPTKTEDIPLNAAHSWFSTTRDYTSLQFNYPTPLLAGRTTAVAASHLAVIMGASEIVLWGVDLTGKDSGTDGLGKYVGTGTELNYWDVRAPIASAAFHYLSHFVPVYKTNEESPLRLPMWPGLDE